MSRLLSSSGYLRGTCLSGFVPFELIIQHFIVVVMCLAILIPGAAVSTPLYCYCSLYFCVEYRIQWRALTFKRGRTVPAWRVPSDLFHVQSMSRQPHFLGTITLLLFITLVATKRQLSITLMSWSAGSLAEAIVGKGS